METLQLYGIIIKYIYLHTGWVYVEVFLWRRCSLSKSYESNTRNWL